MILIIKRSANLLFVLLFFLCTGPTFGQYYHRIEADFSIKEKNSAGKENLSVGRVYFNKKERCQYFHFNFPHNKEIVITDTAVVNVSEKQFKKHKAANFLIDFSVLNLFLSYDLQFFGLNNSPFEMTKIEHDKGLVISTWAPPAELESQIGKMLLSQKNGQLMGLITFDEGGNLASKQFFMDYLDVEGMMFPTQVIQITYGPNNSESKKITTYSHIILNNTSADAAKYYQVPFVF